MEEVIFSSSSAILAAVLLPMSQLPGAGLQPSLQRALSVFVTIALTGPSGGGLEAGADATP